MVGLNIAKYWSRQDLQQAKDIIAPAWAFEEDKVKEHVAAFLDDEDVRAVLEKNSTTYIALDIGCGVGRLMKGMSPHFKYVLGYDVSPQMIKFAESSNPINCYAKVSNGKTPTFDGRSVDFVYSMICFQHMRGLYTVMSNLREAYRVLRPGGVIRIQTHQGRPALVFDGIHGNFFASHEAFAALFDVAGFNVLSSSQGLLHPDWLWVTAQKPKENN